MKHAVKKQCWLLLLSFVFPLAAGAQCWNNINTMTTAPGAPGSNNTWDWTQETTTMYLRKFWNYTTNSCPPSTVTLPMWSQFSSTVNNRNLEVFQGQTNALLKDHRPADGWELLIKEFGDPSAFDKTVENPFFALYNRYTGKVRAFFCIATKPSDLNKKGAILSLGFTTSRKTALLQHLEPIAQPVIRFSNQNLLATPNYYANEDMYWFYADFAVAYDPCTCYDPQNSKLVFQIQLTTEYEITATINGQLIDKPVAKDAGDKPGPGSTEKNNGFFPGDLVNAGKKGYEYYNTWDGYRKNANTVLDQMDSYVVTNVNKQLKEKYPNGIDVNGTHYNPTVADFKKTPDGTKKLLGEDYSASEMGIIKSFTSVIPYVAAVWGVVDFFISQKDKTTDPKPVQAPISTFTDVKLSLNGTMTSSPAIADRIIQTPGSTTNTSLVGIPTYNNILGIVNILKIPDLEYITYTPRYSNASGVPPTNFTGDIRQYRFKEDIKYVVNPAAKMDLVAADAAIVLEFDDKLIFRKTQPVNDVDQMPVEFGDAYDTAFHIEDVPRRMERAGWEIDYLSNGYFNYMTTPGAPVIGLFRIRTPYVPLQCVSKMAFNLFNHRVENPNLETNGICCRNRAPKMMLKVVFTLRRQDKSLEDGLLNFVMTFDLTDQKKNATPVAGYTGLTFDVQKVDIGDYAIGFTEGFPKWATIINAPKKLVLDHVSVLQDLFAQDTIIIKENVYLGNNAHLYAGKAIITETSFFSPANGFSSLNVGKVASWDCANKPLDNFHETNAGIASVCSNPVYTARANARKAGPNTGIQAETGAQTANIYPNPASQNLVLSYAGFDEKADTRIVVRNLTGQTVYERAITPDRSGSYELLLSNYPIPAGTYFLTIRNGVYQKALKFVYMPR